MAIINNIVTEIGDIIVMKSEHPFSAHVKKYIL